MLGREAVKCGLGIQADGAFRARALLLLIDRFNDRFGCSWRTTPVAGCTSGAVAALPVQAKSSEWITQLGAES